jgi:pyruvate kinase
LIWLLCQSSSYHLSTFSLSSLSFFFCYSLYDNTITIALIWYKHTAILLDTKGPEIRTGFFASPDENGKVVDKIYLKKGEQITLTSDYHFKGSATKLACSYAGLATSVQAGQEILVADGSLVLTVLTVDDAANEVTCRIENNCSMGERKNMNLPGVVVDLPTFTEKDVDDIVNFGIKHGVDYIAARYDVLPGMVVVSGSRRCHCIHANMPVLRWLAYYGTAASYFLPLITNTASTTLFNFLYGIVSFIRRGSDVTNLRQLLAEHGGQDIRIICKIENQEGLQNYQEILQQTDAIMVARGDLGTYACV